MIANTALGVLQLVEPVLFGRAVEAAARLARRTTFIAHRLTTIMDADLILVFRDRRIVESGSYEELLRPGGVFTRFVEASGLAKHTDGANI